MAENRSAAKKQVEFDESLFAEEAEPVQAKESPAAKKAVVPKSSLSGASASSASEKASASSSSSSQDKSSGAASDETKNALADIKNTTFSSTVAEGIKSKASISASKSSAGQVAMAMSDGSSRTLLYPKNPSIYISEENARLVDSTRNVVIYFTVRPDGSVPFGEIQIKPASLIPSEIQNEIKNQIKDWKFSEVLSAKNARASFNYSLEIK